MVQGEGFEPPKAKPNGLQPLLVDRLSIPARIVKWVRMEPPVGFEPTTLGLQNRCSNQLS